MRVVGGRLRGRALVSPADASIRPTSDRVRESIFNILVHHDFGVSVSLNGARVLDLFAGTGALGIEALSRGAAFAMLVDDSAESRGLIRQNIEALGLTGVTKIWKRDARALGPLPANAQGPFDLVFLDPPYRRDLLAPALESLCAGGWLAPQAIVLAESAAGETITLPPALRLADTRTYGETVTRFLVHERSAPPE